MKTSLRWLLLLVFTLLFVSSASAVYDPRLGRWLSRDPLGEEGGFNLYAYCGNDPVNRHDPLGLSDWLEMRMMGDGKGFFAARLFYVDDHAMWWGHSDPEPIGALRQDGWVDLGGGQLTSLSAVLEEVESKPTNFKKFKANKDNTLPLSALTASSWDTGGGFGGGLSIWAKRLIEKRKAGIANAEDTPFTPTDWDDIRRGTEQMTSLAKMGMLQAIPGLAAAPGLRAPITLSGLNSVKAIQSLRVLPSRSQIAANSERAAPLALPAPSVVPNAGGVIRSFVQQSDQIYYRVFSGSPQGSFLTAVRPTSSTFAREALALPSGNQATLIQEVLVPAGTRLQRSRALPAFGHRGGAEQFQLLDRIPTENFGPGVPFP